MKHKCVENGGCKAADCDGGRFKSQAKRLKIQGGLEERIGDVQEQITASKLILIQCLANDLNVSPILVEEYNELHNEYDTLVKELLGRCKE